MQLYLNLIDSWATKLKIQLNPSKTAAKIFTLRPYSPPTPLTLNNEPIIWHPQNSTIKYLGLHIDTKLNWKKHIQNKVNQAKVKLLQLKPIINRNSSLPYNTAIIIYKSILRPLLLYACPIWINAAKTNIHKIQIFQNQFLRIITNAPWFVTNDQLHKELSIEPIANHINYLSTNFYYTIPQIPTLKALNLGRNPTQPTRIKNKYPFHIFLQKFAEIDS